MDCHIAKEWIATAVVEEREQLEALQAHVSQCPSCRAEYEVWKRTWALLGTWGDAEPPAHLDCAILAEVAEQAKTSPSWLRQLANGQVWAAAVAAAALAVMVSFLLPYKDALRLCGKAFTGAGLAAPVVLLSFLVGAVYALLPVLVAVAPWMHLRGDGQKMHGIIVGQAFAVIMVPYVLFACLGFEATVIAGILLGTVTGALGGGVVSQLLVRRQHAGLAA